MNSPVVIFVYNRPLHTKEMLKSLNQCRGCGQTELFIYADGPKTSNDTKVNEVRAIIHNFEKNNQFASVNIIESDRNRGLAASVISGVTSIIERYGRVIVLEDDLNLSPYFLEYMNDALDYYKDDEEIWSISGYSFPMKSLQRYPHDVFYSYRGCSWGWATWYDRWKNVDWNVSEYDKFICDEAWMKRFNRGGVDLTNMLKMQMEGKIDSWAIRWCFAQSNQDMYTVYPKISYLENAGCDGSGTHSGANNDFYTDMSQCVPKCRFETLKIEKKLTKEFRAKYKDTLKKKIRRNLQKFFIYK